MVRFTIFGIPVSIQPFFWLTLAIIGALNTSGGSANSPMAMLKIGLFIIAGFISILVHELGHAIMAKKFGAYCHIVLQSFGGYASYSGVQINRTQNFLISAAGPAIQILLAILTSWIISITADHLKPGALYFLDTLRWISWVWAIFNLLPILPLDGGRMLEATLGPQRIRITLWITVITSVTLALLSITITNSFILPIFLGMFAWQAWQILQGGKSN